MDIVHCEITRNEHDIAKNSTQLSPVLLPQHSLGKYRRVALQLLCAECTEHWQRLDTSQAPTFPNTAISGAPLALSRGWKSHNHLCFKRLNRAYCHWTIPTPFSFEKLSDPSKCHKEIETLDYILVKFFSQNPARDSLRTLIGEDPSDAVRWCIGCSKG